jgi:NADPH:quinone reductase-like Zn-dependent oxidoreductase
MHTPRTVWRIDRTGSLARLRRVDERLPPPAPGEVQVAVRAIGLNFADAFACLGLYSATPAGAFVPGLEAAGVVTAVGEPLPGRPAWSVGERVVVLTRFGGYATALNADGRYLAAVPAGWSFAEAAAWPVQALTAWHGLVGLGAVRAGHVVLVQSAAGGVGLQALAILARLGAHPVAVVGSPAKVRFLQERTGLPAARLVVRGGRDYPARLDAALAACGRGGFDIVFDAVLGAGFRPAFERLAPEGRYVLYGAADFMPGGNRRDWLRLAWQWLRRPRLDPLAMISSNRAFFGFNLIWLWDAVDRVPAAYAALAALALPPPHVGQRHPFAEARGALEELKAGHTVGKSVLLVEAPA